MWRLMRSLFLASVMLCVLVAVMGGAAVLIGRTFPEPQLTYLGEIGEIHLTDVRRTHKTLILRDDLDDNPLDVNWSPSGEWLYYVMFRNFFYDVFLYKPITGDKHYLGTMNHKYNTVRIAWSPDSRWVAYLSADDELCLYDLTVVAGMKTTCIAVWDISGLSWSPDSSALFFMDTLSFVRGVYRVQLPFTPQTSPEYLDYLGLASNAITSITVSPDATRFVYSMRTDDNYEQLLWVDMADGEHHPIVIKGYSFSASWNPTSDKIVYQTVARPETVDNPIIIDLHVYDFTTGEDKRLTNSPPSKGIVRWAHPGDQFSYVDYYDNLLPLWLFSFTDRVNGSQRFIAHVASGVNDWRP